MKNFKKLFAGLAIVAMVATIFPNLPAHASYSDELQGAYTYAYGIGITTQDSIDAANMYGTLNRVDMSKMISNYATEVLGKTPDTSLSCNFTDVANLTTEMKGYVVEACQLGLMGQGITAFNPYGQVTRAQFGTVLSRALYGDQYDGGTPYYTAHLQALKDAGIMNDISNPNMLEIRGYVMLMMERAAGNNTNPAICDTPENQLSCSLGLDTCPAECVTNVVKAGSLTVSSTDPSYTSIPAVGNIKFATVTFKAGSSDVNVYGVTFEKQGLSDLGTTKLYFEKDGARISGKASFSQNKATVSFSTALIVKAGGSETVDLYAALSGSTSAQYQFGSTSIDSSAESTDGTITTPLMRATDYTIAQVYIAAQNTSTVSYKVDATKLVELGQFSLYKTGATSAWTDKDVTFKAITLTQSGNASLDYLSNLGLYRNDVLVSTKTTVNGRSVSFVLNDSIASTDSDTTYYVVKGKITNADRVGDSYQFTVRYPENTVVTEDSTNFNATITPIASLNLAYTTINGADVKFNQPAMSYTKDVVPGTLGVVFYSGTISSLSAITLDTPTLSFDGGSMTGTNVLGTIYMKIGTTTLSATPPSTITGNVTFDGTVVINGTVPVVVYADIKSTATATTVKFTNNIGLTTFAGPNTYNDNGQAIGSSIGTLSPITNNVVAAGLQMTNTYSNAQNVQKSDRNIKLADLKFSTTTDVISKISSFQATITGLTYSTGGNTPNNFQGGTVTVYDAAGNALVSDTIVSGTPTLHFVLPNVVNVSKTAPVVFTLKLDQVSNVVVANDTLNLIFSTGGVVARNYITNNSIYPSAATTSSTLTVVGAGTVTTVAQSFSPKLVQLDGSTVSLGTLKFQPFNGDVYLKNINLVLSGYSTTNMPYSEVTVKDSGTTIATLINNGNNNLFATNINAILTAGNTKTYDVVATLKSASTSGDLGTPFVMNLTTGDFESMNGVVIHALPMPVTVSSSTTLVNAKPTISYLSSSKGGNAVYKFRIAANGGDIKLDQLKIAVANNTDAATGTATLYLGNEGGTSLGTSTIATGNNTPTFSNLSGLVDITDGTYQDFTLVFPVSTWYKGTNPGNIGIEMNDINYYDVFTDATTALHSSLFGLYKWDIAPVTTLVTLQ